MNIFTKTGNIFLFRF